MRTVFALALATCLSAAASLTSTPAVAAEAGPDVPQVVKVKPLMVPSLRDGVVERYVGYEVTLELTNPGKQLVLQAMLPRLQDAVMIVFYEAIEKGWVVRGSIVNAAPLRKRIQDASDAAVEAEAGKGAFSRVLIVPSSRQILGH